MAELEELMARIAVLEQQQALQTDALRRIIEGHWTGELPHAAADVVALLGGTPPEDFAPLPFPAPAEPPEPT